MIIIHAGWFRGNLWLWGETSIRDTDREALLPIKQSTAIPVMPYEADHLTLLKSIKETRLPEGLPQDDLYRVFVWLPSNEKQPIPSSPMIDQPRLVQSTIQLHPWQVCALKVSSPSLILLLSFIMNKDLIAPGVLLSDDMKYWVEALPLAVSLVARQQFLPDIKSVDGEFKAIWRPVLSSDDTNRMLNKARAMPAVCRAVTLDAEIPSIPPHAILVDFVETLVDLLVRYRLDHERGIMLPVRQERMNYKQFQSLHDQWIYALSNYDGVLQGDWAELKHLYDQVQEWRRPIRFKSSAPFRLCFRLEEPVLSETNGKMDLPDQPLWQVRYLLQDTSDPSLLIHVEDVWNADENVLRLLRRPSFSPTEYLLYTLSEASRVCPEVEGSLKSPAPAGFSIDPSGALRFLSESSILLEQMGFTVMLPSWWTRKGTKLRLSMRAHVRSPDLQAEGLSRLNALAPLQWKAALGDQELSLKELQELARMKSPLVRMRGQWVHIQPDDLNIAIEFLNRKLNKTAKVRDVIQMALGKAPVPASINFSGISAEGWIDDFLVRLKGDRPLRELSPHSSFRGELRPYQVRGYSWLAFLSEWGLGACLADDMGLGKTVQTLALIQQDWHENQSPSLLVCPTSVTGNWLKEAERFTPDLPVTIHHGIARRKGEAFIQSAAKQALVITSYALLQRDQAILKEIEWRAVILDEAQNIKNPNTKQSQAARSLKADHRISLTGTPVENNVGDLWSIMEFLNSGLLGNQAEFKRNFFIPIQAMRDTEAVERLKKLTGPFILRRLKTDRSIISDLPDKMEMKVFCNLTKEQASLYTATVQEAEEKLEDSEGIQRKGIVLATLLKLKQICNHPTQFLGDRSEIPGRSGKLNRLTEMLEEILDVEERALIFSQFSEMGMILQAYLQEQFGREVIFLHGGTPKKQRDLMVERFQSEAGPALFILSLKAGGTGLNLTSAAHVFHFDRWWNPAVENQATDRAFRIGQTRNVQVHKFICAGTLEERIDELIESKKEIAEGIVGSGEAWLTQLSTDELKKIIALSREAIGD